MWLRPAALAGDATQPHMNIALIRSRAASMANVPFSSLNCCWCLTNTMHIVDTQIQVGVQAFMRSRADTEQGQT